ncbi:MAG TPA: hypothetical protein VJ717_03470 [Gemmatimonadaceae bacterium]|nr:hypothetical protein [Gemmatimonadaceae bacterium]
MNAAPAPSRSRRLAVAFAVGILGAAFALWLRLSGRSDFSDFDQLWLAARALLDGSDPYAAVRAQWVWPLYYPLPAVLCAIPFAPLPVEWAHGVFAGVVAALFAYAITADGFFRLPAILAYAFVYALQQGQWSPLLTAAAILPWLGFVFAAKPTIALAMIAYRPRRLAVMLAAVFTLASIAVMPRWPLEWGNTITDADHLRAPITYMGGPLILLALARWRRPEARLLLVLGCVPQTFVAYETVPLFLVCRSRVETIMLAILSVVAELVGTSFSPAQTDDLLNLIRVRGPLLLLFMYVPALVMILRRPNVGEVPAWLERQIGRWPRWLRGSGTP